MSMCGTIQTRHNAVILAAILLTSTNCTFIQSVKPLLAEDAYTATALALGSETDKGSDLSRKAEILNSPAWRRAIFELGHWLDTQQIYTASQTSSIKSGFNARVAKMSSFELQYLLDDLEAKFQIMDTPEARDARQWVGQYLATVSDVKRSALLKDVPDVTKMTAAELAIEIQRIETKKQQLNNQQSAFNQTRRDIVASQQQSIVATQNAVESANRSPGSSYSPYRGGSAGGKTPFSDVKTGGSVHATVGPFGAYVSF
jgi:hypothetical protein